ncbi:MAG: hypothetical protein K1X89_12975 [Myxococcaceae bacterium]|nr:hypothetical protein [Myxococcaceae bacterium]
MLRAVHAVSFLGLAAAAVAGIHPEVEQLWRALAQPYHCGTAPSPLGLAAALLALVGAVVLLASLVRRRSAPLWASGGILVALASSLAAQGHDVSRRSAAGANALFLATGRELFLPMNGTLQQHGEVPRDLAAWSQALAKAAETVPLAYRGRLFARVEPSVASGEEQGDRPPGTVLVAVGPDAVSFSLRFVGIDGDGRPALLSDERGAAVELRGVFNPDTPPQSGD